ncbi:SDR family oxidoreductase [Longispora fulva]|uniref:NADP-dependent 3-hydroxy acid dehydrogenase YdfG n=1 Tax=Longispora fulva TaxID=619741 RepID=A0A8J7GB75_9ACTN|nr:SDR family oxidoreductase [Longispora fulva]MBG6135219.1 NADP-dependent 3-hydroxy acid dehydrogenase YdfG [Longispora fulva]
MANSLLTGATGGIGKVIAQRLHDRGDRLFLLGRDGAALDALAKEFPGTEVLVADVGRPTELAAELAGLLPDRLDALVHCAGAVELGPVGDLDPEIWQTMFAVNLAGPAELTRLTLPALRAAAGHVVLVNSGAGLAAHAGWGAYAASKFGLRALADALRAEEHGNGVRVTSVYPGRTATAMQEKVHLQEGADYVPEEWIQPDSVASAVMAALDLPRDAEVTDLTVRPGLR